MRILPKKQASKDAVKPIENEAVESAVAEKGQQKPSGVSYEVAPAFKQYNSFLLDGGVVIPVKDGKVTVASDEIVAKLREGGFVK